MTKNSKMGKKKVDKWWPILVKKDSFLMKLAFLWNWNVLYILTYRISIEKNSQLLFFCNYWNEFSIFSNFFENFLWIIFLPKNYSFSSLILNFAKKSFLKFFKGDFLKKFCMNIEHFLIIFWDKKYFSISFLKVNYFFNQLF